MFNLRVFVKNFLKYDIIRVIKYLIKEEKNMKNPILIGCEESQVLCKAFRNAGYEAYSCDLQPTRGDKKWHYQQDIMKVIPTKQWDLIILHPDCTAMAVSGNRWYGRGMIKHYKRKQAIEWTVKLWELAKKHSEKVALENPVSVIFKYIDAPVYYVQPYEHGHGETKKTGFALYNLPPLKPSNIVEGREQRVWKMPPSPTRKRDRSKTYIGIAEAIVTQYTAFINSRKTVSDFIKISLK